jgi:hypothetical protein
MYHFSIKEQETGGYKFELDGIKIITQEYTIQDGKHKFINPSSSIAYFNIGDNIYGVSNDPLNFSTAEDFYDSVNKQYSLFTGHA